MWRSRGPTAAADDIRQHPFRPQKQPWGTYAIFKDTEGNIFVIGSK
jgi:hypothetical protein